MTRRGFSGGLIYVPEKWTRPAEIGVDVLTSVYVSMGMTPPPAPEMRAIGAP